MNKNFRLKTIQNNILMNLIILFFSLVASPLLKYKFDMIEKNIYSVRKKIE
jgi:hypothetical protein